MTGSGDAGAPLDGWRLELVEDLDLPGWVYLPSRLSTADREVFTDELSSALMTLFGQRDPSAEVSEDEVRQIIDAGLTAREQSDAAALYQVWPVAAPLAVLCDLSFMAADDVPDWRALPGRSYAAEARHIGPGVQFSRRGVVEHDGEQVEVSSVHLTFADTDIAVMVSLLEAPSELIARTLGSLGLFKNAIAVVRGDGRPFVSLRPPALGADDEWDLGGDAP